jgi:hypothetical protein
MGTLAVLDILGALEEVSADETLPWALQNIAMHVKSWVKGKDTDPLPIW